ncbi:MAG: hypothetical protein RLZZ627_1495 [Pseudomonadota bacterium]
MLVLVNLVFLGWKYGLDHWGFKTGPESKVQTSMDPLDSLGSEDAGFDLLPTEPDPVPAQDGLANGFDDAQSPPRSGCMSLGPFATREEAESHLTVLGTLAKDLRVTNRAGDVAEGYWVLFTKATTREGALANRQLLLNRGFYETWLFDRGPLAGSIALGLYPTEEEANAALVGFRERGINAKVRPRLVRGQSFWIKVPWQGSVMEFDEAIQTLKGHDGTLNLPSPSACS